MSEKRGQAKVYYGLSMVFWLIGGLLFLLFLILIYLYYFTKAKNSVTFAQLFGIAFALGSSGLSVVLGSYFHFVMVFLREQPVTGARKMAGNKKSSGSKKR